MQPFATQHLHFCESRPRPLASLLLHRTPPRPGSGPWSAV